MKRAALLVLAGVTLFAERSGPARADLTRVEKAFDRKIEVLFDEPFLLLGLTRGVYLSGYGAVFSTEVELVTRPGLTAFRPALTKDELARIRNKKIERLPLLKQAMRDMLPEAATMLNSLPPQEQVVVALTIFQKSGDDNSGIPSQVVMQAGRKELLELRKSAPVKVVEF